MIRQKTSYKTYFDKSQSDLQGRIRNIQQNYMYEVVNGVLKTKAQSIIIEDLNVKGMLQNPKLAKGIQEERLHEFKRILTYKCKRLRINLVVANRWFPSSKLCNVCGYKNVDLSLKIRWTCPICKTRHDRDENAAINLEKGTVNSNFMLLYILKDGEIKQCMNGIN